MSKLGEISLILSSVKDFATWLLEKYFMLFMQVV